MTGPKGVTGWTEISDFALALPSWWYKRQRLKPLISLCRCCLKKPFPVFLSLLQSCLTFKSSPDSRPLPRVFPEVPPARIHCVSCIHVILT